jgi:hypothetical protein
MIKTFLFATYLITITFYQSFAQEKQLYGFGALEWGASKLIVKEYMESKYDLFPGYEKDGAIGYQGGHFFNQDLYLWVYFFNEEGLEEVDLVIRNNNSPAGGIFSEVMHQLILEYGDPELYKPDDWNAEWFYYDSSGKKLNATIKVSSYEYNQRTTIKITFLSIE